MRRGYSSRLINRSLRSAGVIRANSRRALLPGVLALVTVAGFTASARGSNPAPVRPAAGSGTASAPHGRSSLPPAAQKAVSPDRLRFSIRRTSSGAVIVSDPTQGLNATLSAGWIAVRGAHGLRVSLSGPAMGRDGRLTPVRGFAAPALNKSRVTFSSSGVDEWYAKSPLGVEQGFAIADRPAGKGPLEISQGVSGNAAARVQAGRQGVRFGSKMRGLDYGHLIVNDATGARVPASLSITGHRLTITIADAGADYPLRVDPIVADTGGLMKLVVR